MKILIATDYYLPHVGGIPSHIQTISEVFIKKGNDVCIIAPSKNFNNETILKEKFTLNGISSLPTFLFPDIRFVPPFNVSKIKNILKEYKPDVAHVHFGLNIGRNVAILAKKYGIPLVATNHFMLENFFDNTPNPEFYRKLLGKFVWNIATSHLKNADIITTPTRIAASYLGEKNNTFNVLPISNGINLEKYNKWKIKENIFRKYNIPKNNKIGVFVGRLVKEKRVDVLIKSLPKILNKEKFTLIIVGRGNWIINYKNLAKYLRVDKNIVFADYLSNSELMDVYKSANVFIMPSVAELQSIATLEAMASGLPVVAANAMALPTIVKDGVNGYLFKPDNLTSLANNVLKIISIKGRYKKMGMASVQIAKKHDVDLVAMQFEEIYQKAIAINELKQKSALAAPFYLTRGFATRMAFALFLLGVLFRNLLISPTLAKAKTLELKNKILNSKIVTKIENIDLNLKTTLPKAIINK